ncbi:MAG: amidase family protein [Usitatibacter sp.]
MNVPDRPAVGTGLHELTAVQAVAAMHSGEIGAEEYARALLGRAKGLAELNAFRTLDRELTLSLARAADQARARGAPLGPLHGLPIPVKDSVNTRDLPTSNGTRALRDFRPRADAPLLDRLFGAGAYLMGKTNLQELSRGWTSNNGAFGAVRNPYDPARVPGGSSGGSAAAVAARMAPLAVAEDTWGSIRVPAAWCGVAGLRPTHGRYPNGGVMALTLDRFDQVGALACTVGDLALFDRVASGDDRPIVEGSLRDVRLGVPAQFVEGVGRDVERVVEDALRRLEAAGAVLVRAPLPDEALGAADAASTVIGFENLATISDYLAHEGTGLTFESMMAGVSPNIRLRYASAPPTREARDAALTRIEAMRSAIAAHFAWHRIEALVFPPLLATAPPLGDNHEVEIDGERIPLSVVVGRNTALGNCGRLSSLVLPAGTAGGLPVALEFDALPGTDRRLLAIGFALERALGPIPAPGTLALHGDR